MSYQDINLYCKSTVGTKVVQHINHTRHSLQSHLDTKSKAERVNENLIAVHLNKHEGEGTEYCLKVVHFIVLHLCNLVQMPIEQWTALANIHIVGTRQAWSTFIFNLEHFLDYPMF